MKTRMKPIKTRNQRLISNLRVNDTETQHELLRFTGNLAGTKAVFLVDSGSTRDFIAQNFVERQNLEGTCSEEKPSLTLADGSSFSVIQGHETFKNGPW